jgi:hypothetical protein
MKNKIFDSVVVKVGFGMLAGISAPGAAFACACGCGVFDVGTSSMLPEGSGGLAYLNFAFQDQNKNWSGTSSAAGANNDDKKIKTQTYTAGLQYMFNRSWGAQIEIPIENRTFDSSENAGSLNWTGLGDIRIKGVYTGFSDDLSTGVNFGAKLPTGSYDHTEAMGDIDRDTQIGSGSTDVLLGAFHRGSLNTSTTWNWFSQAQLDVPVLKQGDFRPGLEANVAAGVYYDGFSMGKMLISPIAQVIGSWRGRDNGAAADPDNSGYQRILLSPGVEFDWHPVKLYADVELPVYQNMTGNQLISPVFFKVSLSYMF